ncbi:MAG: Uma2 family endonuclease [Bacteroidetes bacterium]|nr:MAG: Uma2 family endonuclease [Bacteroidota bacterium]
MKVPEHLILEIMDGKPIHYKGYREVLAGTKSFSEITGSSTLQSLIVTHIVMLLGKTLDESLFTVLTSEAGIHLNKHNNLAGDILVFDTATLPISSINEHYAEVAPRVVVEVDISADPMDIDPDTYFFQKTQKLLSFGVEKVIWIMTKSQKVTVATAGADWQVKDWGKPVEILDGVSFNIGAYLAAKGSPFA